MTIKLNVALGRCLAGSALGALVCVAFVPPVTAQWATPWGAAFPDEIERSLEAQGYVLTAPLMRRPGVYLADVSAGPARRERLIIDARSGQVLERFPFPGRTWGPALAARDDAFGDTQSGGAGPPLNPGFSGEPSVAAPIGKSAYGGSGNVHIPAASGLYGHREPPAGAKASAKGASTERKAPATKLALSPPLPPPAPREAARLDGAGSFPPAGATTTQGSAIDESDKPKVSIVPPAAFE
jgi:hypothetical protein